MSVWVRFREENYSGETASVLSKLIDNKDQIWELCSLLDIYGMLLLTQKLSTIEEHI